VDCTNISTHVIRRSATGIQSLNSPTFRTKVLASWLFDKQLQKITMFLIERQLPTGQLAWCRWLRPNSIIALFLETKLFPHFFLRTDAVCKTTIVINKALNPSIFVIDGVRLESRSVALDPSHDHVILVDGNRFR
jgi:hypothetical protein